MGLDMYAYVAAKAGQQKEYYEAEGDYVDGKWRPHKATVTEPREIAYWRKHPNLHGWMERLAEQKGLEYNSFNGIELELTWEDIDRLEKDIKAGTVAQLATTGFFFGDPSDEYYKEQDLEFCLDARRSRPPQLPISLELFALKTEE